jgi:two-component system, OmpR family, sensor histidine kinase QseC
MTSPRSLQGRLLMWVLGVLTMVWLAASLATWVDANHELDELLDGHLAQAASLLVAQQIHEAAEGDDRFDAPPLHRYAPRVAFQVWKSGRLVLRSANAPDERMSHGTPGFQTLTIGATSWRVFASNIASGGIQVYVGERSDSRAAIMVAVMRSMLWPLLIALPLLGLASWWSVRYGLGPLRRLGQAVAQREPHAVRPIAMDEAPAEMLPLIGALNRLFERIAELLESERRFTADAAHELRTPIAAIRTQAQVALGALDDVGQRQRALLATLQGCDRATHLVEQLLTLSRLETVSAERGASVNLSEIARRAVADLVPLALERRQGIEVQAADACWLEGEPALLGVLVRNLVDNAIRYSPVGAPVLVEVNRDHSDIVLGVADGGSGLDEAQQRRLGERFFRVLGTGQSGSGLGWSIVRRIAVAHGASITIGASPSLAGLAVHVRFKADPRAA